jgi:hypothetical protein
MDEMVMTKAVIMKAAFLIENVGPVSFSVKSTLKVFIVGD